MQLVLAFAPAYVRQIRRRPFRVIAPEFGIPHLLDRLLVRHRAALYDGCLDLILAAWREITGTPLREETGTVTVLLTRVAFAFDDEFERRHDGDQQISFGDVIESDALAQSLEAWRTYMSDEHTYQRIRTYLFEHVERLHSSYLDVKAAPTGPGSSISQVLERAELDSGGLLSLVAHVIALFNGLNQPDPLFAEQMYCLGVAGKIADDMTDFRLDAAGHRPNLLWEMTLTRPAEHARMLEALHTGETLTARWWRTQCPRTNREYVAIREHYVSRISSPHLRIVWAMMWLPARFAHALPTETRGRL